METEGFIDELVAIPNRLEPLPTGDYTCVIEALDTAESKIYFEADKKTPKKQLKVTFCVMEPEQYAGRKLVRFYGYSITPKSILPALITAAGLEIDWDKPFNLRMLNGRWVILVVSCEPNDKGEMVNTIGKFPKSVKRPGGNGHDQAQAAQRPAGQAPAVVSPPYPSEDPYEGEPPPVEPPGEDDEIPY